MPTPFPGTVACNVTLAEFCGGPCPTYAQRVEQMRRTCAGLSPYIRRWAGHCPGVYYYVHEDNLVIGGFEEQFDGSGVMIGGLRYSDTTSFCNRTAFSVEAGIRLTCPVALDLEELCTRR
jgi:hypothetical protein